MSVERVKVAQDGKTALAGVRPVLGPSRPSRVLLIDDDENTRVLVKVMLESTKRFEVVGEAEDSSGGIALAGALRPDVVVVDIQMPGQGGVDAVPLIRKAAGATKIVVFSDRVLQLTALQRRRTAADLLLPKGSDGFDIRTALLRLTSAPDTPTVHTKRLIRDRTIYGSPGVEGIKVAVAPDPPRRNIHEFEEDIL